MYPIYWSLSYCFNTSNLTFFLPNLLAQEFILNKKANQDIDNYEEYILHQQRANQQQQSNHKLSPGEQLALIDHKQRMLNRTSAEREMTPDSISNEQDQDLDIEEATRVTKPRLKQQIAQKKKIPLSLRPNSNKRADEVPKPRTNTRAPSKPLKQSASVNQSDQQISNKIPINSQNSTTSGGSVRSSNLSNRVVPTKAKEMPSRTSKQPTAANQISVGKKTTSSVRKVTTTRVVVSKAEAISAKVMPVVEEGLSDDELDEEEKDEEANGTFGRDQNLIEYDEDENGRFLSLDSLFKKII